MNKTPMKPEKTNEKGWRDEIIAVAIFFPASTIATLVKIYLDTNDWIWAVVWVVVAVAIYFPFKRYFEVIRASEERTEEEIWQYTKAMGSASFLAGIVVTIVKIYWDADDFSTGAVVYGIAVITILPFAKRYFKAD